MITEQKKNEYWDYFTSQAFRNYRFIGMTDNRLQKVKPFIWEDMLFWFDVITTHRGLLISPQEMEKKDWHMFDLCISIFFEKLSRVMTEKEIIK